jgi:hypothetical protein
MQANSRESGGPGVLLEPVGDVLGVEGAAVRPGEDIAMVPVASSDCLAVLSLELALGLQRRKGDGIEGELVTFSDHDPPLRHASEQDYWL